MRLRFRHRIGLLVALAALALLIVAMVVVLQGRRNEEQLSGIEHRYVPLLELDRDLKKLLVDIQRALEDAANAAEETKLVEADGLVDKLVSGLRTGAHMIVDNGGDPAALESELRAYYAKARAVSAAIAEGASAGELATEIEVMVRAQQAFTARLDAATSPDRSRLTAAFESARESQRTSRRTTIIVACVALVLMTLLSWRLARNTVRSLQAVSDRVERLASGEIGEDIKVTSNDELGELAREANRTAVRLREYRARGEREDWIKTGLGDLSAEIAGELDVATVGTRARDFLIRYTGAATASIRTVTEEAEGERSLDVVVRDQKLAVPLVYGGRLMGVLELVMPEAPDPDDRVLELLKRSQGVVGVALRVAESRERANAALVETQRQARAAETANKELESFSYSVSHDLRAPLRAIDGFSQTLVEDFSDSVPAKGQDYLRRIRAAAQRMAELIDDLLQLSRVSRGEFRRERVDVSNLATIVVAELRRAEPSRVVDVRIADTVAANADPRLIRIVLDNLIGNAWKFTAKTDAAAIELSVREDGGETVYCVRDNGAGFDMKYADRLFGAFQRLHTDKEFTGTGIGLATVQRIIHRHGGRIWAESEVSRGASFFFTLTGSRTAGRS
jgi:signal transduction histidine kinase